MPILQYYTHNLPSNLNRSLKSCLSRLYLSHRILPNLATLPHSYMYYKINNCTFESFLELPHNTPIAVVHLISPLLEIIACRHWQPTIDIENSKKQVYVTNQYLSLHSFALHIFPVASWLVFMVLGLVSILIVFSRTAVMDGPVWKDESSSGLYLMKRRILV